MSRINLWLGQYKKSIQVALFPLWPLKHFNIEQNVKKKKKKKKKEKISWCEDKTLVVKIDIFIFMSYFAEKVFLNFV